MTRAAEVDQEETRLKPSVLAVPWPQAVTADDTPAAPRPTEPALAVAAPSGPGTLPELAAPPLAADRARAARRARDSFGGRLAMTWAEASPAARWVTLTAGLLAVAAAGLGLWTVFASDEQPVGVEGARLGPEPLEQSFGLGPGVDFSRPDFKLFTFQLAQPVRSVAIVHFDASGISKDEVAIVLNGVEVGTVAPDGEVGDHEHEQMLPLKNLKRNDSNQLVFDNVKNPPGHEPWRIANLWLEVLAVPELPVPELLARAAELAQQGKAFKGLRDVGSGNLFKAWKSYRQAWLTLLAVPEQARPEVFAEAQVQMAELSRLLDQRCRMLLLEARRDIELKSPEEARQTLEDVARHFPTTEHRCHNQALRALSEYQL